MRQYYRSIIFTKTPLKTQYNYRDVFQILPISSQVAPSNQYANHFPIFLEYYIDFENDVEIDKIDILTKITMQQKIEIDIINLLSVLTNHRFFRYQNDKNSWAICTPNIGFDNLNEEDKKLFNNQFSSWSISGYFYPGLNNELNINCFTKQQFPETSLISSHYDYFTNNPIENINKEICFPDTITNCLDNYYKLSNKTLHKVKSCIYLACDGIDISDKKRSLGFLSYISAIEGLLGLEMSDKEITFECGSCKTISNSPYHCKHCGRPIWGINTKFVEFLKKFVANSEKSAKTYKEIYNLRSKITHKGQLFIGDYELSLEEAHLKNENIEWIMRLKTLQLFKLSLSNWLMYPHKLSK